MGHFDAGGGAKFGGSSDAYPVATWGTSVSSHRTLVLVYIGGPM